MSDNNQTANLPLPTPEPPQPLNAPQVIRKNLREQIESVFDELGGAQGMIEWVEESKANKRIFYKDILPKVIPKQVQAEVGGVGGGPMKMVIEWAGMPQQGTEGALACGEAMSQVAAAVLAPDEDA